MALLFVCFDQGFKEPRKYIAAQGNLFQILELLLETCFIAFLRKNFETCP